MRYRIVLLLLAGIWLPASENLLPNADMEQGDADGVHAWGGSWTADAPNHVLRFAAGDAGEAVHGYRAVAVGDARAFELRFRARWDDVQRGSAGWHDARVIIHFHDADGTKLSSVSPPHFTGSSDGWQSRRLRFRVPEGAARLVLMPGIFHARSGVFDLDDLVLSAIDPQLVGRAGAADELAVPVDAGGERPPALRVDGAKLRDVSGAEVWLQGVSVPSLEWSNQGESVVPSIIAAIEDWEANVIRLPVSAPRWFGETETQDDDGEAYRALVDDAVLAAASRGCYLLLDLHHYRAPRERDLRFWRDAAQRYAGHPAVLFGLLNEPHGIDWETWRNGGVVGGAGAGADDAVQENQPDEQRFHSPGMQALLAAVRESGADNVAVIGGLDWAYDLSGVLDGYAIDDPDGRGVVYDSHVYPWKRQWQERFLAVAEKHPVLLGEVGADRTRYDFVPPERFEDPYTWAPDVLACIQQHRLHWTAWAFHDRAGPAMLQDRKDYRPTPYWGAFVRAALRGARFASDRLR